MIVKTEKICVFLVGGVVYGLLELLWRGYTHWSMVLAGGLSFLILHLLNRRFSGRGLLFRCFLGSAVITSVELAAGVIVNLWLGLDVWDYSGMAFNVLGQICPIFSLVWFLICIPAYYLSSAVTAFFNMIGESEVQGV